MAKEKKQELTQELIGRLRADGYCFDPEHMSDMESFKAEVARLKSELESKNVATAAELEKKISELQAELKQKKDRIYDLEDELKASKEESETYKGMWEDADKKIASVKCDLEREFRRHQFCFNQGHLYIFKR